MLNDDQLRRIASLIRFYRKVAEKSEIGNYPKWLKMSKVEHLEMMLDYAKLSLRISDNQDRRREATEIVNMLEDADLHFSDIKRVRELI